MKIGIEQFHGRARFVDVTTLAVGGDRLIGRRVLIAAGAMPAPLNFPGADHLRSSEDFLNLDGMPARIVFVGGPTHYKPLRDRIAEGVKLDSTLDNDANCAVFGEWWQGAAKGGRFVVGLTIGTGIGGGIVLDGQLFHGASDVAAEIGHTTIDLNGRRCKCGNYGCIEAYASGPAIAARAVEGLEAGATSNLAKYVHGDLSAIDAQVVYQASHDGDEFAKEVVRDTARYLGATIGSVVNLLNPDVVVICGGVTLAGEQLFAPLREEVRRRAFKPAVAACRIVPGSLPGTAGVYGAAATFKVQRWGKV